MPARPAPPDADAPAADAVLDLRDVRKGYREGDATRDVLRGASMRLGRGTVGALVGRSGAGKSTVLNLISGIDQPDDGAVVVDGQHLERLSERERTLFRRRHIGFVFQFYNLVPTLTVAENVRFLLDLNRAPDAEARAASLLADVGLADRADAFPDRLSGGEQQRVAIARALAHDPALVLADEPTGDLDARTGRQILDLLEAMTRERGRTLLMVTHDENTLDRVDTVFRLADGRLEREEGGGKRQECAPRPVAARD
ncbi:ABC transporter ATP-binding protein [Rubrivirga litoralis]|uniref:ABC transporter ATP-binding protein n=1 Tax=Rubrivirga litoralis TaxID=3075598 RepID=A0ABU3BPE7_9BACT|nr:ABC transporter ATP-binding protein [Rubrivirga sp. F394]MDT0631150.1 ABC transporter ATP-binding protein [Rubrivirga sp. F394]